MSFLPLVACLAVICAAAWFLARSRRPGGASELGRSFDFEIKSFREVDPALLVSREEESIPVRIDGPMGIAVDRADNIYVCGQDGIVIMSPAGKILSPIPVRGLARCVAVDEDGTVYVGVEDHVEVFSRAGERLASWTAPAEDALITSIGIKGEDVYLADAGNSRLLRYDKSGADIAGVGGFVLFSNPNFDVAVGPDASLWVVNPGGRELRKYDDDLEIVTSWKRPGRSIHGFSGCCNPTDIAIRGDGSIVTSEKFIVRVKVLSPEGKLLGVVAGPDSFAEGIRHLDLAVDSRDRILVLDPDTKAVRVFVDKGKEST